MGKVGSGLPEGNFVSRPESCISDPKQLMYLFLIGSVSDFLGESNIFYALVDVANHRFCALLQVNVKSLYIAASLKISQPVILKQPWRAENAP